MWQVLVGDGDDDAAIACEDHGSQVREDFFQADRNGEYHVYDTNV